MVLNGLDRLTTDARDRVDGARIGLLCHAASVDRELVHITQRCRDAGLGVVRCFGPEHGIWGDAQDMIGVGDEILDRMTGAPVVSLYGADEASLAPKPEHLADLDVLVIDLQDVGARYYTYIYTAALAARVAAQVGTRVVVLDRPNPLGGMNVEGALTEQDYTSFVGYWPLPVRHGLTIGEVLTLLNAREGFGAQIDVVEMIGWRREMDFEATGRPWVQPSPNMPTPDTAFVYPGLCLVEGTNLSEGRGTTRPFELIGADFIDPFRLAGALGACELPGVRFRPVFFRPTFHKFGGQTIGGIGIHVTDRREFEPLRTGLHFLACVRRLFGDRLRWRTETYEFVRGRLAIDLLFGGTEARHAIDGGAEPVEIDALWRRGQREARQFEAARMPYLRYD